MNQEKIPSELQFNSVLEYSTVAGQRITYSYNVSRYVDPTESGEFEGKVEGADYYRNDFTATEIKINEINVSEDGSTISMKQDGYQSTTYIDSQTGEIRYQHTKTSDSESTMMVVYSKVDENSIDRVFKVKSNGEIEEQVDPGIRGLSQPIFLCSRHELQCLYQRFAHQSLCQPLS